MFIRQHGSSFQVLAPAKLNLFLEILAKRDDGFHEIETLIVAINWFDTLILHPQDDPRIGVTCQMASSLGDESQQVQLLPKEKDNLVYRALRLLQENSGCQRGAAAMLLKRIPPASGLGGGSSDAAAALLAGNRIWKLNWRREQLCELAAELGSDVPFFLTPREGRSAMMAVCSGRGEIVEPARAPAGMHFVVARPSAGLSTPEVYRQCTPAKSIQRSDNLLAALLSGNLQAAKMGMINRLESAASEVSTTVDEMRSHFAATGAIAHQLSGSGSAYFGWYHNARAARRAAGKLRAKGLPHVWQVQAI